MNVIVSNKLKDIINNANIDAIKDLNGLFSVEDLINKFKNYFFSRMILDATSVVNFASKQVLTKLAEEIGSEKLIILLPSNPKPPVEFKKLLIELKIYNFTTDINEVLKFIETPNTYEDAIKTVDNSFNNNMYVDNSIKESDEKKEEESKEEIVNEVDSSDKDDKSSNKSLGDILNNFNLSNFDESTDTNQENEHEENDDEYNDSEDEVNIESQDISEDNISYQEERNESFNAPLENTFLISDSLENNNFEEKNDIKKVVIGFKNITLHAGSTSLIYMLHKMVVTNLKKDVLSIEIDKDDFKYYRNSKMISVDSEKVNDVINNAREELIFVDLNDSNDTSFCTEVLYLVEPSTIKLNKLMVENKDVFKELHDKKVIINKSLLTENDIKTLSSEAGMEFFDNIKPLNDRIMNNAIEELIGLLEIK